MPIALKKTAMSTVYAPRAGERPPGVMYPRALCLAHQSSAGANGRLLATFEQYTYDTPVFSIYMSPDQGRTWSLLSMARDLKHGWGLRFQPQLFEVPRDTGCLRAGDILLAGNAIPDDMGRTELQLYRSRDCGVTWSYLSSLITGGPARTENPDPAIERPVWEPYLLLSDAGDLVCYYSDEHFHWDLGYNQLLAHKVSPDGGLTWGEAVTDVALPGGALRPGMPVVERLPGSGFIMIYEIVNEPGIPNYVRFSPDGLDWGDPADPGVKIVDAQGDFLTGTPYIRWIPQGGPLGTLIASGRAGGLDQGLQAPGFWMVNYQAGRGLWKKLPMLVNYDARLPGNGYSQTLLPVSGGRELMQLVPAPMTPRVCQLACGIGEIIETA